MKHQLGVGSLVCIGSSVLLFDSLLLATHPRRENYAKAILRYPCTIIVLEEQFNGSSVAALRVLTQFGPGWIKTLGSAEYFLL